MSDDAKKTILARRARFIAAAMAGVGVGASCDNPPPEPCLSVAFESPDAGTQPLDAEAPEPPPADTGPSATPEPCLSMPADGGARPGLDAGAGPGPDAGARAQPPPPRPCLTVRVPQDPPPPPRPCLTPPRPREQ